MNEIILLLVHSLIFLKNDLVQYLIKPLNHFWLQHELVNYLIKPLYQVLHAGHLVVDQWPPGDVGGHLSDVVGGRDTGEQSVLSLSQQEGHFLREV